MLFLPLVPCLGTLALAVVLEHRGGQEIGPYPTSSTSISVQWRAILHTDLLSQFRYAVPQKLGLYLALLALCATRIRT